jgi:CHAT domain
MGGRIFLSGYEHRKRDPLPLFTTLLNNARARDAGIFIPNIDPSMILSRRAKTDRAWFAWVQAYIALANEQPGPAFTWLSLAGEALTTQPDSICRAEVISSWMDLYDELDEARDAFVYARESWKNWFALASGTQVSEWMSSLNTLLRVLAPEATSWPSDSEVLYQWMLDRLAVQVRHVFKQSLRLHGTLKFADGAEAMISEMQQWVERNLAQVPAERLVVLEAEILEDAGNLYDHLGDLQKSYDLFMEAIERLKGAIDHPQVAHQRAQIRFNAANELAKLKEHVRAATMFDEVRQEFLRLGEKEPAIRAQHGSLVARWHVGTADLESMLRELEEVLIAYEAHPADVSATDLRQNLDQAYRLWLTLAAPRIAGDELLIHRFLGQLYASREGLTQFVTNWPKDPNKKPSVILSEVAVLLARLSRHEETSVLVVETGTKSIVLTTIRGGAGSLTERVRAAVPANGFVTALEGLLRKYNQATDDIIDRTLPIRSRADKKFLDACQEVWRNLPPVIQEEVLRARRLIVLLSNVGNVDEIPVELWHDGTNYLGLKKEIVRAVSLNQLCATLSENRMNVDRSNTALVVRASDIAAGPVLSQADPEVAQVAAAFKTLNVKPTVLQTPAAGEFLDQLGSGYDLFHYVGHGLADEIGEELRLSDTEAVSAVDLLSLRPAPAPVCVASSCLVGRARHLRSGFQRGIVVALLARGAPTVVAATEEVPDQLGKQFAATFYSRAANGPLGAAMLATRQKLAEDKYHAAAWGSFVMFGDPEALLLRGPRSAGWPALLLRLAATDSKEYAERAKSAIRNDSNLSPDEVIRLTALVDAFSKKTATFFTTAKLKEEQGLKHDAEGYLAYRMLLIFGNARFAKKESGKRDVSVAGSLKLFEQVDRMLNDSYLRIAAGIVARTDIMTELNSEGRRIKREAAEAFHWLAGDAELKATKKLLLEEDDA